jgi:hypothetical protein
MAKKHSRLGLKKTSRRKRDINKRPRTRFIGHDSERFASYDGVHEKRKEYLLATMALLRDHGNGDVDSEEVKMIDRWLCTPPLSLYEIDYARMQWDGPKIQTELMHGAYRFVNHSDCSGNWDRESCAFIAAWLKAIRPYLETELLAKDPQEHAFRMNWEDRYVQLFEWAGNQLHGVVMCC